MTEFSYVIDMNEAYIRFRHKVIEVAGTDKFPNATVDVVDVLFFTAVDYTTTVYEFVQSPRPYNLLQPMDVIQATETGLIEQIYQDDFIGQLSETSGLYEEDGFNDDQIYRLASAATDVIADLLLMITTTMYHDPRTELLAMYLHEPNAPIGVGSAILRPHFQQLRQTNDLMVSVVVDQDNLI